MFAPFARRPEAVATRTLSVKRGHAKKDRIPKFTKYDILTILYILLCKNGESMERKMRSERIKRIREVISAIKKYQMCGPGDDPDQVTNVTIGFRSLVIQLKRLAGPLLPESIAGRLESINPEVNDIYSAYEAASELSPLVEIS